MNLKLLRNILVVGFFLNAIFFTVSVFAYSAAKYHGHWAHDAWEIMAWVLTLTGLGISIAFVHTMVAIFEKEEDEAS